MLSQPIKLFAATGLLLAAVGISLARRPPGVVEPPLPAKVPVAQRVTVPVATGQGYGQVQLRADGGGQYHADVEIAGTRIPMLVDTGATRVSLTFEDSRRLGVAPAPGDYTIEVLTANGRAKAAPIVLPDVRLGTLRVGNVTALVLPRDIQGTSLLGMSFLRRLGGFEIVAGTMVLKP